MSWESYSLIVYDGDSQVCVISAHPNIRILERRRALICAAPELAEALRVLLALDGHGNEVPPESPIGRARAALALLETP